MGLANNCNKLIIPTRSCEVLLSFPVHLSSWGNGLKSLTYDRCTPFSRAPVISFDCRSGNLTCSLSLASLACLRTRTFFFFLFDLTVILPLFQNSTHFLVSHNSKSQQITSMLDFPNHTVHSAVFVYFMYKYIEHWYASHIIYFKQYTNNCTLFEYGISEVWIALLERFWLNTSENVYPFWLIKETESLTSAFPWSDCFLKLVRIGKRSVFYAGELCTPGGKHASQRMSGQ